MKRPVSFVVLVLAACLVLAAPARADEGEIEDSPAGKQFRDAWWAETGAGDLQQARRGYEQALAAEGSEGIRARALYRLALVLERMGRTEEAVQALERLSEAFPAQQGLLRRAKERLAEWTALDLRESFSDWYSSYQYSPEFQAKIVDLILKLGSGDNQVVQACERELLTIGEPALPALREHAHSPNKTLRNQAVELMLRIGELPQPGVLWEAQGWRNRSEFWKLLAEAPEPRRAAFATEAAEHADDYRAAWISAFLEGPMAVLDVLTEGEGDQQGLVQRLLWQVLQGELPAGFWTRLRAIAEDPETGTYVRQSVAHRLLRTWHDAQREGREDPTGLEPGEMVDWLRDETLRKVLLQPMRLAWLPSASAWRVAAEVSLDTDPGLREQRDLLAAMSGQLRRAAPDVDLELAVRAWVRALEVLGANAIEAYPLEDPEGLAGTGALPRAALATAITRGRGQRMRGVPQAWWQGLRDREGAWEALLAWTHEAAELQVRHEAMRLAAVDVREDLPGLMAVLAEPARRSELCEAVIYGLRQNRALADLEWDGESLAVLVETVAANEDVRAGRDFRVRLGTGPAHETVNSPFPSSESYLLYQMLQDAAIRDTMFRAALEEPERFTRGLWALLGREWRESEVHTARAQELLRAHLPQWHGARRTAGLLLFVDGAFLGGAGEELTAFLRGVLAEGDLTPEVKLHLVQHIEPLGLDDLKALYDFRKAQGVDLATTFLGRLPRSEAVYDAFVPALRPDGPYAGRVQQRFALDLPSRQQDLARRLLAHESASRNQGAVRLLKARDAVEDLPIWVAMLGHPRHEMRKEAAVALGRMYDEAAVKALARLVDDPHPEVRDAALASLERIQEIEEQKKRWRAFAK